MDLPMITEATFEFYRNIYADPELGPIFKGINMVVLRNHVSYFLHQLTMFDTPMTQRQIQYLKKVHTWVVQEHHVTQRHYDIMMKLLMESMGLYGAQEDHLKMVKIKLEPLRTIFPPEDGSAVVGTQGVQQQAATAGDSRHRSRKLRHLDTSKSSTPVPGCVEHMCEAKTAPPDGQRTYSNLGKPHPSQKYRDQDVPQKSEPEKANHRPWLQRLTSCLRPG